MTTLVNELMQNRVQNRLADSGQSQIDTGAIAQLLQNNQQPVNSVTQGLSNLLNTYNQRKLIDQQAEQQQAQIDQRTQALSQFLASSNLPPEEQQMLGQLLLTGNPELQNLVINRTLESTKTPDFNPTSPSGKRVKDRLELVRQFGEDSPAVKQFDSLVTDKDSDVLSPEAFQQKLDIARESAISAQQVASTSPQAQANLQFTQERIEALEQDQKNKEETALREKDKFNTQKQKASLAFEKSTADIDEFIRVADDLANSDLDKFTGVLDQAITKNIAGTEAANIAAKLQRLQALSAFGSLQDMRASSPTGGALGQVSERELELLSNAQATIQGIQDTDQLRSELKGLAQRARDSKRRLTNAFGTDFGESSSKEKPSLNKINVKDLESMSNEELQALIDGE